MRTEPDWPSVYNIDLVYEKDCWKLCGDAHCCNFSRHKSRFSIIGKKPFQELPLLPGEYEFMESKGWLAQFKEDFEHKKVEVALDDRRAIHFESIVSYREGCACDHGSRPTICRLYPVFPVLDVDGRVLGIEKYFGIYEELENLDDLERACKIDSIPLDQIDLFHDLVGHLTASPLHLFYLHAYGLTKRHAVERLQSELEKNPQSSFGLFEWRMLRKKLFDKKGIRDELAALADRFEERYPDHFRLPAPAPA